MKNSLLGMAVPPLFLYYNYLIAKVGESKEKLFTSKEEGDDSPSKEDDQKNDKLFDQLGIHKFPFPQWAEVICIFCGN